MNLIGNPVSRNEIQSLFGLKGKELTVAIKSQLKNGVLIRRLVYIDPSKSNKRKVVFQFVAKNMDMFS